MKIVFALIWLINGWHESRMPVKVGEYEKWGQCNEQAQILMDRQGNRDGFACVPVNTTGGK